MKNYYDAEIIFPPDHEVHDVERWMEARAVITPFWHWRISDIDMQTGQISVSVKYDTRN